MMTIYSIHLFNLYRVLQLKREQHMVSRMTDGATRIKPNEKLLGFATNHMICVRTTGTYHIDI